MPLEINKLLTLSTCHISKEDSELLEIIPSKFDSKIGITQYGFFIWAGNEHDIENTKRYYAKLCDFGLSESLIKVLLLAIKNDCTYVYFDRDAPSIYDYNLDIYEW